jgi:hypothetical protein
LRSADGRPLFPADDLGCETTSPRVSQFCALLLRRSQAFLSREGSGRLFLVKPRPTKTRHAMSTSTQENLAHAEGFAASLAPLYSHIGVTVRRIVSPALAGHRPHLLGRARTNRSCRRRDDPTQSE